MSHAQTEWACEAMIPELHTGRIFGYAIMPTLYGFDALWGNSNRENPLQIGQGWQTPDDILAAHGRRGALGS